MANNYFHFKEFTIEQDRCSMKVGTDGVLLGSWTKAPDPKNILDIGSGTGLIALMLSQRYPKAKVLGIELDKSATDQAIENVSKSPFSKNIEIINGDFTKFNSDVKFDLIVSNPPFFNSGTPSENIGRSIARHSITLGYEDLIIGAKKLIDTHGIISLIAPSERHQSLTDLINKNDLFVIRECTVYPNKSKESKRTLLEISKVKENKKTETLILEKVRHEYTDDAKTLFKDFYQKL